MWKYNVVSIPIVGGNAKEMIMNLDIDVKHSDPGAVILFTSSLNEAASNVIIRSNQLGIMGYKRFSITSCPLPGEVFNLQSWRFRGNL